MSSPDKELHASTTFTLDELSLKLDAKLCGDGSVIVDNLSSLKSATATSISFLSSRRYQQLLDETKAGAVILSPDMVELYRNKGNMLIHKDPYLLYAYVSQMFQSVDEDTGIDKSASIDESVSIDPSVFIGQNVIIGRNVSIGKGVRILANTVIRENSKIGDFTCIKNNVSILKNVTMGKHCTIFSGAVIGSDGFGFAHDGRSWVKIAQLGGVQIGDRVEVGANSTIDCGALDDTVICDGVIIDDQVHIAHNVYVGENTAIAGYTAMAGGVVLGKNCLIGGGSRISGHITVADRVKLSGGALLTSSIKEPGKELSPVGVSFPQSLWKRNVVRLKNLGKLFERVKTLENQIKRLNNSSSGK